VSVTCAIAAPVCMSFQVSHCKMSLLKFWHGDVMGGAVMTMSLAVGACRRLVCTFLWLPCCWRCSNGAS
jgi:hypothetical protein